MPISPESSHNKPTDFRAPPPSPVAAGRRSSVANDDVLTEFLEHSLHVPDLILPDRVFPRQKSIQNPPKLYLDLLNSMGNEKIIEVLDSICQIGCFELVNHKISSEFILSVTNAGTEIFKLLPEKKAEISRSGDRSYGFVEFHGEEERETSEEFVWCRDEALKLEMEGICPIEYSNFSGKMEMLLSEIENIAETFLRVLYESSPQNDTKCEDSSIRDKELGGSICYLNKHCRDIVVPMDDQNISSLRYDVIRMMIRGSEYSHALCLYLCNGSSEFHVYSKKGWVSFFPDKDAIVITIGDQIQAWSGGKYKHVIGRPIFKGEAEEECISMAFLYSPPSIITTNYAVVINKENKPGKTISFGQQALLALLFTLFYNVFVYVYYNKS